MELQAGGLHSSWSHGIAPAPLLQGIQTTKLTYLKFFHALKSVNRSTSYWILNNRDYSKQHILN